MVYSAVQFNILREMKDFLNCKGLRVDAGYDSV